MKPMLEREKRPWAAVAVILAIGGLACLSLLLPPTVLSSPLNQDAIVRMDAYASDVTMHPRYGADFWDDYGYAVYVPPGSRLNVWVGEGGQGGCYWALSLKYEGSYVDSTSSGSAPNTWSDRPASAVIGSGYAEVYLFPDTSCDGPIPHDINVRFAISDYSPEPDTPTPTRIPPSDYSPEPDTPTAEYQPPRQASIEFWADHSMIRRGECTTLHWRVENVNEVYYEGGGVTGSGDRQECPTQTTTYELNVRTDQGWEVHQVWVTVEDVTPTLTPSYSWPTHTPTYSWPTDTPTRPPSATPLPTYTHTPQPGPTNTPRPGPTPTATMRPTPTPTPTQTRQVVVNEMEKQTGPKLLVVTNSQALGYYVQDSGIWADVEGWLDDRYGSNGYDLIDLANNYGRQSPGVEVVDTMIEKKWAQGSYWAIFLIGGHMIVPHAQAPNPLNDGDIVWTDDLYADFNDDWVPDTALARLPDGGSRSLLQTQLTRTSRQTSGDVFALANVDFTYVESFAVNVQSQFLYSPPFNADAASPRGINSSFVYFDLVNVSNAQDQRFNRTWYGWDFSGRSSVHTPAFYAADANSQGVVVSATSYGAWLFGCNAPGCPNIQGTIPLEFLANGARAYIGATALNYITPGHVCYPDGMCTNTRDFGNMEGGLPDFTHRFLQNSGPYAPLSAYYLAKVHFMSSGLGQQQLFNRKMGQALVYYGVPDPDSDCLSCMEEQIQNPTCPSGVLEDCDGDQLPDQWEHQVVQTFKPYFIFHPEDPDLADGQPPPVYWQVSPASLNGVGGVWLTMITAWTYDSGITRYDPAGWSNELKCRAYACLAAEAVTFGQTYGGACAAGATGVEKFAEWTELDSMIGAHAGDTEGLRFFIAPDANDNWLITHIDWKRHEHERFGDPVPIDASVCYTEFSGTCWDTGPPPFAADPVTGMNTHPVLYVAKGKHAVYPSPTECEDATFNLTERIPKVGDDIPSCTIYMETCPNDKAGTGMLLETPFDHNVGERERVARLGELGTVQTRFHLADAMRELPGEYAWSMDHFCGGVDPSGGPLRAHGCAGGMGKMWYPVAGVD
jgi:hypothetical protein